MRSWKYFVYADAAIRVKHTLVNNRGGDMSNKKDTPLVIEDSKLLTWICNNFVKAMAVSYGATLLCIYIAVYYFMGEC